MGEEEATENNPNQLMDNHTNLSSPNSKTSSDTNESSDIVDAQIVNKKSIPKPLRKSAKDKKYIKKKYKCFTLEKRQEIINSVGENFSFNFPIIY